MAHQASVVEEEASENPKAQKKFEEIKSSDDNVDEKSMIDSSSSIIPSKESPSDISAQYQTGLNSSIPLKGCKDKCENDGICLKNRCYCNSGWTGDNCSSSTDDSNSGYPLILASTLALLCVFIGVIIGLCYIGWKKIRREPEDRKSVV